MEMSHRGKAFVAIAEPAEADLRELLAVPKNYKVLFLQGGATAQFAGVPLNLTTPDSVVDYVNTGAWSKKAIGEAKHYAKVNVAADAGEPYASIPPVADWRLTPERRVPALHAERDHRRRRVSLRARGRRDAARRGHVLDDSVAADRRVEVRRDLRRRAEEHRPRGAHARHRARRSARSRAPSHAGVHGFRRDGEGRLDAEHAADVRLVHGGPRVSVVEAPGRTCGDGRAQSRARRKSSTRRSTARRSIAILSPRMRARG